MKLGTKLALAVFLITLGCGIATSAMVSSYLLKSLQQERLEDIDVVVQSLANQLADGVINQDPVAVRDILRSFISRQRGVDFAYLLESNGNILAHTFGEKLPAKLPRMLPAPPGSKGKQQFVNFEHDNNSYLIGAFPLLEGNELGTVHVAINCVVFSADIRRIITIIMAISLAVATFGVLAATYAASRFTRPLQQLVDSIADFGSGASIPMVVEHGGPEIRHLFTTFHNMAESRNKAEAALRFQGALLEAQNSATLDGVLIVSSERKVTYHNRRFLDIWSIPAGQVTELDEELLATCLEQLQDQQAFKEKILYLYQHPGENSLDELAFKDGRIIERYSAPIAGDDGNSYGRIWFFRDITERKQAEANQALLTSTLNASMNEIYIFDADTLHFEFVSVGALKNLGYSLEEIKGMTPVDLKPEHTLESFARLTEPLRNGTLAVIDFETTHLRANGTVYPVEVHLQLLDQPGHRVYLAIILDITERKRAEKERSDLEMQLLHVQKLESLGVLAGGIAHDFNNILTSILGNTELAKMQSAPDSPVIENLHRIEKAAQRAADLARQMLAYSGRGVFLVSSIDLNNLVEEMGHMLEVSISKKVQLALHLNRPLPSVDADPTQIRQIVMNLVINASEAIGDNNGTITITTGSMECDRQYLKSIWRIDDLEGGLYVFIEVSDTGCGMDRETQARIFDPFFTTKFTGRGLGMAAVQGIVRGHRGGITIYSEPGSGSTFKILLPASGKPAGLAAAAEDDVAWKGGGVVLLVDDEEMVREIGTAMLNELGYQVITADDGHQAIEAYTGRNDIALVILDLTMPQMDGVECFRELRRFDPEARVIISSGYSEQEISQKFVAGDLSGIIQKPFQMSTLRTVLKNVSPKRPA